MKKHLKKISHIIIPKEKNGNIPHILKEELIAVIAVFVAILFYFNQFNFDIIRNLNLSATVYPAVLADLTNDNRLNYGVSSLVWNSDLEKAAKLKAEDMAQNNYFAHTSPSGVSPWYWLKEANYNFIYAGENLAVDFTESVNVQNAWLQSPKHRDNLLNSKFTEIGIATAEGFYQGRKTTFVVQFFGQPLISKLEDKNIKQDIVLQEKIEVAEIETTIDSTVAGAMTQNIEEEEIIQEPNISIMSEDEDFILIRDDANIVNDYQVEIDNYEKESFSSWSSRFLVNPTMTISIIYFVLLILILSAMLLVLFKEYQKHHLRHLILGSILVIILFTLLYFVSSKIIS
jgi:hypothetical protein